MNSFSKFILILSKKFLILLFLIAQNPNICPRGSPGFPGKNGVNGHNGLPGRDGRDGTKGQQGVAGPPGPRGFKGQVGRDGAKGEKGVAGSPGPRGSKGEAGASGKNTVHKNWKQCVWKKDDSRDIGLIKVSLVFIIEGLGNSTRTCRSLEVMNYSNVLVIDQ